MDIPASIALIMQSAHNRTFVAIVLAHSVFRSIARDYQQQNIRHKSAAVLAVVTGM